MDSTGVPAGSGAPHARGAETLFAEFLARRERGHDSDFEVFVAAHPEYGDELRRLHADWSVYSGVFSRLGANAPAGGVEPRSALQWKRRLSGRKSPFERYRLEAEIGRGGMGSVWMAWDSDLQRTVALKRLHGDFDPRALARFLEEAQIAAQLDHPAIVAVHEVGLDDQDRVYYTMPLVRGKNLEEVFHLAERGAEGWTRIRVLEVLARVCDAIAYAHSRGVIHRDLKPANVMIGAFGEVFVVDWGLARVLGDSHAERPRTARSESDDQNELLTRDGDVVGTPAYMSPEQARGELSSVGPAWDVYALGAILHRWLAGTPPHVGPGEAVQVVEFLERVRGGRARPLAELAPEAPAELVAIAERALERDPTQRYASAAELAAELRAFVENRVVRAHRTGAWVEFAKWVRRNRAMAAAIAVALLAAFGGIFATASVEAKGRSEATRLNTALSARNSELEHANQALRDAEALARREEREAERRRAAAEAATDFMVSVFDSADPSVARGVDYTASQLLASGRKLVGRFASEDALAQSDVLLALARSTAALDDFEEAWPFAAAALELRERELGPDAQDVARAKLELGVMAADRRLHELAVACCESAWSTAAPSGIVDNDLAADIGTQLALAYGGLGSFAEAEASLRSVDAYYACALDREDVRRFEVACNLGQVLNAEGRPLEAVTWLEPALAYFERTESRLHPNSINCASHLGLAYGGVGRFDEAEACLRRALDASLELYPDNHSAIAIAMNNLAEIVWRVGRRDEALELRRQSLDRLRQVVDADDPLVLGALNNLVPFFQDAGLYDEALESRQFILDAVERRFGSEHPTTLIALNNLGWLYVQRREFELAEPLLVAAWQGRLVRLGPTHPETAQTIGNFATLRGMQQRWSESEELHVESLRARDIAAPIEPGYVNVARSLSIVFRETGRRADARSLLEYVLRTAADALGTDHPATVATCVTLERLCEIEGRWDEAYELACSALQHTNESDPEFPRRVKLLADVEAKRAAAQH
jgi:hypothetical protein